MPRLMNHLANFLTSVSLFFGFVSIISSLENHFTYAAWAIILSVVFDGLDGQVARKNSIPSEFGKQLDSLVDVISFGIAPAILGYVFVYKHDPGFEFWATLALFVYLVCSVARLAKYNITPKEDLRSYFTGLPTTAAGGVLASFILIYRRYLTQQPPPVLFFLALVLVLAYLMVSKVRYLNLDGIKRIFERNAGLTFGMLLVLVLSVAGFYAVTKVFLPEFAIFMLFFIYLLFFPFMVKFIPAG